MTTPRYAMSPSSRPVAVGRALLALGIAALWTTLAGAAPPEPMAALIEWEHPYPAQVSYFRMHFADTADEKQNPRVMQVGLPGAQGRYRWSFTVEPNRSLWVAVEAVGPTGLGSPLSQWRRYEWQQGGGTLGLPGRPVRVEDPENGP